MQRGTETTPASCTLTDSVPRHGSPHWGHKGTLGSQSGSPVEMSNLPLGYATGTSPQDKGDH